MVVRLVVRILRPLVRIMLRHGITVYEFAEVSRWMYARAAMERGRFEVRHRNVWAMTKSRCAVLTGMTRRQVDRQLGLAEPALDEARRNYNRGVRILAAWQEEPGYQDAQGLPRALAFRGAQDSFEALSRKHCRDIPVRTMLDELESRGCVVRPTASTVAFVHANFDGRVPATDELHQMEHVGENFMALLEQRLYGQASVPFIEVASPPLAPAERRALQLRVAQHVEALVAEIRHEMLACPRPLLDDESAIQLVGIYWGSR
ncbi:MAG: hypothetical protein KY410_02470 [Proteobacteria bacterium]|nr:hypothetical protein [Pseudomonadota bacterium]